MKYNKIRKMDIADGPGVRVSIFMQGCALIVRIALTQKHMTLMAEKNLLMQQLTE